MTTACTQWTTILLYASIKARKYALFSVERFSVGDRIIIVVGRRGPGGLRVLVECAAAAVCSDAFYGPANTAAAAVSCSSAIIISFPVAFCPGA